MLQEQHDAAAEAAAAAEEAAAAALASAKEHVQASCSVFWRSLELWEAGPTPPLFPLLTACWP